MFTTSIKLSLVAPLVFGWALACSSDPTQSSSDKLGTGSTSCGSNTCPAGQYCAQAQTGSCTPGCTSDQNCASGSKCTNIDDVIKVGTCSETQAPKDCAGFLKKCQACGGGTACTQSLCDRFSSACVSCVAQSNCGQSGAQLLQTCGCN